MLLGTFGASLLENMLTSKGVTAAGEEAAATSWRGQGIMRAGWGTIRAGFLLLVHHLIDFEI